MFLNDVINLTAQLERIRRNNFPGLSKSELARSYAKLELKFIRSKHLQTKRQFPEEILGYKINYLNLASLRLLFHEVFLQQDYCFATDKVNPFIIDCGSNIGASILYFAKRYPEARIIGFEPFGPAFLVLQSNIEENHLRNVTVYNLGLSGSDGEQELFYDPSNPGSLQMSFVAGRTKSSSRMMGTTTLSKYIDQPVDFLKMDIEGSEMAVVEELTKTNRISMISQMVIEYHHHIKEQPDSLSRMLNLLESNGFGYHVRGHFNVPPPHGEFQDILIFAYQA